VLGGNDTVSNCVTLCGECHNKVHDWEKRADGIGNLISEGIKKKQEAGQHHGPAPIGFEKDDGQLVEGEEYHRVCEVLEQVARGDMSQRQAAKELDCARKTIRNAIEERSDLYGL
jgi:DNA invertase Pin-like site-specific DNA recombinase